MNPKIDSYYFRQSGIPSAQEDAAPPLAVSSGCLGPQDSSPFFLPEIEPAMGSIKAVQQSSASLTSTQGLIPKPQQLLLPLHPLVSSPSYLTCQAIKALSSQD